MVLALLAASVFGGTPPEYAVVVSRRIGATPQVADGLATSLGKVLDAAGHPRLGRLLPASELKPRLLAAGLPDPSVCNGASACVATLARVSGLTHLVALQVVKVGGDLALDVSVVESRTGKTLVAEARTLKAKTATGEVGSLAAAVLAKLPDPEPEPLDTPVAPPPPPPPPPAAPGSPEPPPTVQTETAPPKPSSWSWGLRAELLGAAPVSSPQSQLYSVGFSGRASAFLGLRRFIDVLLGLGYGVLPPTSGDPLNTGASWLSVGVGGRVHRPWAGAQVIPSGDVGLAWVLTGPASGLLHHLALLAGGAVYFRGAGWPVALGPAVRFEYVVKLQSEASYPGYDAALLSFGVAVEWLASAADREEK
ncbi:MAG: hypothetical protein IT380_24670 [Myxococcales bacterium]|nr:hypothetical protein [Myxococcales bacterium]